MTPLVRIYMLTEDSGGHSHATWSVLLRRMCRLVDTSCDTSPEVFMIERPEVEVEHTMAGTGWRTGAKFGHAKRVQFWKTIADQLDQSLIVVFHVDGDVVWSCRDESENVRAVKEVALRRLRDALAHRGRSAEQITERMAFFVAVHPFREIEAWLFHNVDRLRRECERRRCPAPACLDLWETPPEALDEEPAPKSKVPFKAEHNRDLAETLAVERVYELGSSFYHAVEDLGRCRPLRAALRATYAPERWQHDGR